MMMGGSEEMMMSFIKTITQAEWERICDQVSVITEKINDGTLDLARGEDGKAITKLEEAVGELIGLLNRVIGEDWYTLRYS